VEFADSLVFTADSLVKGAEVGIRNAGPAAVVITTGRVDTVRSSSGAAEPALKVAVPANVTVPAKSQATVLLRGDSAWLKAKPGRYVASLILTFAGGSLQRRMVVTRAAPPAPPVRPLVGTVKFRPRSWLPWGSFSREVQVPVLGGVRPPPAGLVGLATADGTPARAEVGSAVEWNEDSRVLAYPVRLTGLHGGRSYSGVIQLVPGDDASKATLNVDASDQVIWVLIVVALGVAAGILFRQWRDVGQPVSYLRERELRLGRRFGGALREYAAAGGKAKRLGAQLREVRRGLETELRAAGRLLTKDTAAATRFDDLQKQLDVLEAQADGIRALARAHGQLRSTAAAALQIAGPRPEGLGLDPRPRLVLAAEKALEGADVRLLPGPAARCARVHDRAAAELGRCLPRAALAADMAGRAAARCGHGGVAAARHRRPRPANGAVGALGREECRRVRRGGLQPLDRNGRDGTPRDRGSAPVAEGAGGDGGRPARVGPPHRVGGARGVDRAGARGA